MIEASHKLIEVLSHYYNFCCFLMAKKSFTWCMTLLVLVVVGQWMIGFFVIQLGADSINFGFVSMPYNYRDASADFDQHAGQHLLNISHTHKYMNKLIPIELVDIDSILDQYMDKVDLTGLSVGNSALLSEHNKHHSNSISISNTGRTPFNASRDLFVLITIIPYHIRRLINAYKICSYLRTSKISVQCRLFIGLDALKMSRNDICKQFANSTKIDHYYVTKHYCYYKASTKEKVGNIITKIMAFKVALTKFEFKNLLLLEADALIYDNFVQLLTNRINELLIEMKLKEFDILQLKPWRWCENQHFSTQIRLNTTSKQLFKYKNKDRFAIATGLIYSRNTLKWIVNNSLPIGFNFDRSIGYLINNPFKHVYAHCPAMIGEIGGYSTLIQDEYKPFQLPGYQRKKTIDFDIWTDDTYDFQFGDLVKNLDKQH